MSINYNKSRTTAFYENGVYSDNYNSLNNTITISNPSGNTTILGTVNINSVSNNNETVKINCIFLNWKRFSYWWKINN